MEIKAVLTDFDGTLIDFDGKYDDRVPQLIKKLQNRGIPVAVATGRACIGSVAETISKLDLSPLNIFNGGSVILNWKTKELPLFRPISSVSTHKVVEYLSKQNLIFSIETWENAYMLAIVDTAAYTDKSLIKLFTQDTIPQDILKILVHGSANKLPESTIEIHKKNILNICKDVEVMKFAYRTFYGLDVTSEESTKHTAVIKYAKLLGISPREIVAIGDGHNDYPLFTACGYKIAMGNAPAELKDIADIIVAPTHEGGMVQALEHIFAIL